MKTASKVFIILSMVVAFMTVIIGWGYLFSEFISLGAICIYVV